MRAQIRIGFTFLPRRWVVERLLAWINRIRELSASGYEGRKRDLLLERLSPNHDRRSTRFVHRRHHRHWVV
jgi:transposase